jgi:hypothetical protein
MLFVVDARDLGVGDDAWFDNASSMRAEFGGHHLHHFEPLDALGVPRRRQVIGEPR